MTVDYKKSVSFMPRFIIRDGFFVLWQYGPEYFYIENNKIVTHVLMHHTFEEAITIFNTVKSMS
jgi:hypothetical protein